MATQVQWRRGTHAQVAAFTGAVGEIAVDTTQNRLVVQDGVTPGGWPQARQVGDTLSPTVVNDSGGVVSIAAAATTDLGALASNYIQITGNTAITSFGSSLTVTAPERELVFAGTPTLINSASLICPTGANISAQVGDVAKARYEGSGVWRIVKYQRASGLPLAATTFVIPGYITGLGISNDGGTPNTVIDVAVGQAADSTGATTMTVAAGKTVNFAASGAGGLDTGAVANSTWYAILVISGASGTAVMATKETAGSVISPTMPSGYTYYRYIGSVKTDGSAHLLPFFQFGQTFYWGTQVHDLSAGTATVATLLTISVPPGVNVAPIITAQIALTGSSAAPACIWSPSYGSTAPQPFQFNLNGITSSSGVSIQLNNIITNTAQQVYYKVSSGNNLDIYTTGWIDPHVAGVW